ncbi:hypothetical protein JCM8097_007534 [Rhodosporidiobolus ruineniae]
MEILSESESRSFAQFLDAFSASSSATAPPSSGSTYPAFAPPPPAPSTGKTGKLAGLSRMDDAKGAAPIGGWASTQAGRAKRAGGGGGAVGSYGREGGIVGEGATYTVGGRRPSPARASGSGLARQPTVTASAWDSGAVPPAYLDHTASSSFSVPPPPLPPKQYSLPGPSALAAYRPSSSSSSFASFFPPKPPSYPSFPAAALEPNLIQEEQKRARMAQHTKELEAMMRGSGAAPGSSFAPPPPAARQPSGMVQHHAGEEEDADGEGEEAEEEAGSPPFKRTRSDEDQQQPLSGAGGSRGGQDPLLLMLEAEKRAGFNSSTTFGSLSSRTAASSSSGFAPPLAPPPASAPLSDPDYLTTASTSKSTAPQKRKAPAPSASASKGKSTRSKAKASSAVSSAPPPTADPDAPLNAAPALTPRNIPLAPPRPSRASHSPSSSRSGGAKASTSQSPPPADEQPLKNTKPEKHTDKDKGKPALLTAEQKKANHIASEQKRRAAIRAGYDGLTRVVPVLRAAVEEYESRLAAVQAEGGEGAKGTRGGGGRGKKAEREKEKVGARGGRGRDGESATGALMGGIEIGGEKIDGRAGPKSEAIVLAKTVDHLRLLLSRRSTLLTHLSSLYASSFALSPLPTGPPAGSDAAPVAGEWDEPWAPWMRRGILGELGIVEVKGEDEDVPVWEDE